MSYYFVRVAGKTGHNNPNEPDLYIPDEPPKYPKTVFNYYDYCLRNNFVRIGWPNVGDLIKGNGSGSLSNGYTLDSIKPHIRKYLLDFSHIPLKSVILMPNKDVPGNIYMGEVYKQYEYYHDTPKAPYECAHRLGVSWDRDSNDNPVIYHASDLGIGIIGGWWLRAFHILTDSIITDKIDAARQQYGK